MRIFLLKRERVRTRRTTSQIILLEALRVGILCATPQDVIRYTGLYDLIIYYRMRYDVYYKGRKRQAQCRRDHSCAAYHDGAVYSRTYYLV